MSLNRAQEFRKRAKKALRPNAVALLRAPQFRASAAENGPVTVVAYGPIFSGVPQSEGEVTDTMVAAALESAGGRDIIMRLNSPGGDAFAGITIGNLLRSYSGKTTAIVDGIAASAASVAAMGADRLLMSRGSQLMIHRASMIAIGNAETMRNAAEDLELLDVSMAETYSAKCGMAVEETLDLMDKETYMSAKRAVANKFANGLAEDEDEMNSEIEDDPEAEDDEDPEAEDDEDPEAEDDEDPEAKAAKEICKALGVKSLSAASVLVANMVSAKASVERTRLIESAKDRLTPAAAKSLAGKPLRVVREVLAALPKLPKSHARAPRVEQDGAADIQFSGEAARQLGIDPAKVRAALAARKPSSELFRKGR